MTHGIPPESAESIARRLAKEFFDEGLEELDLDFGGTRVSVTRKPKSKFVPPDWRLEYEIEFGQME